MESRTGEIKQTESVWGKSTFKDQYREDQSFEVQPWMTGSVNDRKREVEDVESFTISRCQG